MVPLVPPYSSGRTASPVKWKGWEEKILNQDFSCQMKRMNKREKLAKSEPKNQYASPGKWKRVTKDEKLTKSEINMEYLKKLTQHVLQSFSLSRIGDDLPWTWMIFGGSWILRLSTLIMPWNFLSSIDKKVLKTVWITLRTIYYQSMLRYQCYQCYQSAVN